MVLKKEFGKRGIVLTMSTIFLLSLFMISFSIYTISHEKNSMEKRVETMNTFVYSLEEDLPRQVYASGFRIIFIFEKKIVDDGAYIDNFDARFEEAFFNGTVDEEEETLMAGVNFEDIITNINLKANKVNAIVNLTNASINITQEGPWEVKVTLTANMTVNDSGGLVYWKKQEVVEAYIPIENFEDPIYVIGTNSLVTNRINITPYRNFVQGSDITNLTGHLQNSYYINSTLAPSFLNRLQGNFSASPYGIESLVYLPELSSAGVSVKEKSCVDYIYFSTNDPASHQISGMPYWFRVDDSHLNTYQVSGLAI